MVNLKGNFKLISFAIISSVLCFMSIMIYVNYFKASTVYGSGDVSVIFNDVNQLKNESDYIAEVEVIETISYYVNDSPFTLSKAKIKTIYKGEFENDIVNILENGGVIGKRNYIFENNPVFNVGEKAIVYLHKYSGPVAEEAYFIRGAYQGKFKLATSHIANTTGQTENGTLIIPPNEVSEGLSNVKSLSDLNLN